MNKSVAWFVLGALLVGAAFLGPATLLRGLPMLVQGGAAFALTMVPALLTLIWGHWAFRAAGDMRLIAGLGSSGVRMFIALGGGLMLALTSPELFGTAFWLWLSVFYLIFLALEITLLVQAQTEAPQGTRLSRPNETQAMTIEERTAK